MRLLCCFLLSLGLLSSCSISPKASVKYHPRFDFSAIESYSFYERNSDFTELQNIRYALRNNIELAIEKRLENLGLTYKEPQEADFVVSYYLLTNNKKNLAKYNKRVKYCDHCLNFYTGNARKKSWRQVHGSLLIDLVDTKRNRTVWRSIYPMNLKSGENSQQIQQRFDELMEVLIVENPRDI